MSKNPYGSPPRDPGPLRRSAIEWYGERWFVGDAVRAVGIHLNTYGLRRRRGLSVKDSLTPPDAKDWKPKQANRAPRMPTRAGVDRDGAGLDRARHGAGNVAACEGSVMARKKVSTCIYLDEEQHRRLLALKDRSHVPWSVMAREGVDLAIEKWEKRYPAVRR